MHIEPISLLNSKGKVIELEVHVADDDKERAAGYQHICKSIIDTSLILFVLPKAINSRFHMNNVKAPLDIGFFDDKGKLISVLLMQTYDDGNAKLYSPGVPFQYALEARSGFFSDNHLFEMTTRLISHSIYDSN